MARCHQINELKFRCKFRHTIRISTKRLIKVSQEENFVSLFCALAKVEGEIASERSASVQGAVLGVKE